MRVCSSGFPNRSKALNRGLVHMPNDQLWRDCHLRLRTYRMLSARQGRGHKNFNGRGEHSRGKKQPPSKVASSPVPPSVNTSGSSQSWPTPLPPVNPGLQQQALES